MMAGREEEMDIRLDYSLSTFRAQLLFHESLRAVL